MSDTQTKPVYGPNEPQSMSHDQCVQQDFTSLTNNQPQHYHYP